MTRDEGRKVVRGLATDQSENTRLTNWWQWSRAPGEIRADLFRQIGLLPGSGNESEAPTGTTSSVPVIQVGAPAPKVLPLNMPPEGTPRHRQVLKALQFMEIGIDGRNTLANRIVSDADRFLGRVSADLAGLTERHASEIEETTKARDAELDQLDATRDRMVRELTEQLEELSEKARELRGRISPAAAAPTSAVHDVLMDRIAEVEAKYPSHLPSPRLQARAVLSRAGVLRERIAQVRVVAARERAEVSVRWARLMNDLEQDHVSQRRVLEQRREAAAHRHETAKSLSRSPSLPGLHGTLRTIFDVHFAEEASGALDELRRDPRKAAARDRANQMERDLQEDLV